VAQEAERESICPVAEERNLLHRNEEVWRKLLEPPKNARSEPCHWEPDAPRAAHPDEIRRRIPGVAPSTIALWFSKHAHDRNFAIPRS
jgi:hypothetical protein